MRTRGESQPYESVTYNWEPGSNRKELLRRRLLTVWRQAAVALLTVCLVEIGHWMSISHLNNLVSLIWPATGLGLAMVHRYGYHHLIGFSIGCLIGYVYLQMIPAMEGVILTIVIVSSIALANWIFGRVLRRDTALESVKELFLFLIFGPLLCAMIQATLIVFLHASIFKRIHWSDFFSLWGPWWLATGLGILIVAPFILVWTSKTKINWENRQILEVFLWLLVLLLFGVMIISNWAPTDTLRYPLELSIFPIMAWAAIRFGPRGATAGSVLIALLAVSEMLRVLGPEHKYISQSPEFLWLFIGVVTTTSYFLAAIITEVKHKEEEAASSEGRLRAFIDALPDTAFVVDRNGRYLEIFASKENDIALRFQQLKGKTLREVWPPDVASVFQEAVNDTLRTGVVRHLEYRLEFEGQEHWFEGRIAPIYNENGENENVIWVAYNITERKEIEESLESRDRLLEGVAQANTILLTVKETEDALSRALAVLGKHLEVDRVVLYENAHSDTEHFPERIFRRSWQANGEVLVGDDSSCQRDRWEVSFPGWYGTLAKEGVVQGSRTSFPELVQKNLENEGIRSLLVVPVWAENYFWGVLSFEQFVREREWNTSEVRALQVAAGCIGSFIVGKQSEEQLKKAKEAADAASVAKGEFLAMMSHEIRTPMNSILGFTDLLAQTNLDDFQLEYLQIVNRSGRALLELINNILDYSKIESRGVELEYVPFSLEAVVLEVIDMVNLRAREKGLKLDYTYQGDGPEFLRGDPHRLRQVILNLTNNAIKFTAKGNVKVDVECKATGEVGFYRVRVAVMDTGIGIPEEKLEQLFQPFSQVDSSITRQYGGSGLGLVISKRLIEKMGGEIEVQSVEGKGSVFSFELIMTAAETLALPSKPTVERLSPEFAEQHPLRILVVEDDANNRLLIEQLLRRLGYTPELRENGNAAVDALVGSDYDLVLMDIQLPGRSGLEIIRQLRAGYFGESKSRLFVVAVTAYALSEDRRKCLQAGADEYLPKPVDTHRLKAILIAAAERATASS